jgi:hypothetical protein
MPARGPACSSMRPSSGPPIAAAPMKTSRCMPMTRPRIVSCAACTASELCAGHVTCDLAGWVACGKLVALREIAVLRQAPEPWPEWVGRAVLAVRDRLLPGSLRVSRLVAPARLLDWRRRLACWRRACPHRAGGTGGAGWGCRRVQDELPGPGGTAPVPPAAQRVLERLPVPPAPQRGRRTWRRFLRAQGCGHAGGRFVSCRLRGDLAPQLRVLGDRGEHPPWACPRRRRAPCRAVDGGPC